tara:strand:- start:1190 stop:1561 length:372 start_codon:yes stop_codon:yes gene_type:complete
MNSRQKGARGERMFRDELRAAGFHGEGELATIRGCQNAGRGAGGTAAPDVIVPMMAKFHWEIKFREKGTPRQALEQAGGDSKPGQIPVVGFKKNYAGWIVCLSLEDFFEVCRQLPTEWLMNED